MSYILDICNLLESEGYISKHDALRVLNWLNPHEKREENEELYELPEEEGEENLQELHEDRIEAQRAVGELKRRYSGGEKCQTSRGCREIKVPELNTLIMERILRDANKCQVLVLLATGNICATTPNWTQWSKCVEELYTMPGNELHNHLKLILNKAVTKYNVYETIDQLLSLYKGDFFPQEYLDDVCGPSVSEFLTVMRNNFDMQFTTGEKFSWLFAEAPNLVVARHALIVRNRLRECVTTTIKSLEKIIVSFILELEAPRRKNMGKEPEGFEELLKEWRLVFEDEYRRGLHRGGIFAISDRLEIELDEYGYHRTLQNPYKRAIIGPLEDFAWEQFVEKRLQEILNDSQCVVNTMKLFWKDLEDIFGLQAEPLEQFTRKLIHQWKSTYILRELHTWLAW